MVQKLLRYCFSPFHQRVGVAEVVAAILDAIELMTGWVFPRSYFVDEVMYKAVKSSYLDRQEASCSCLAQGFAEMILWEGTGAPTSSTMRCPKLFS